MRKLLLAIAALFPASAYAVCPANPNDCPGPTYKSVNISGSPGTLSTSGLATLNSLATTGPATIGTTLGVTGASTLTSGTASGAWTFSAAGTAVSVTNNATVGGTLAFGSGQTVKGTLAGGAASASLTVAGGTNPRFDIVSSAGTLAGFAGVQTSGTVNSFQFRAASTGNVPQLISGGPGSDTNTSLNFQLKGTTGGFTFTNNSTFNQLAPVSLGSLVVSNHKTIVYAGDPSEAQITINAVSGISGTINASCASPPCWQNYMQIQTLADNAAMPMAAGGLRALYIAMQTANGGSGNRLPLDVVISVPIGSTFTADGGGTPLAARFTTSVGSASLGGTVGAESGSPFGVDIEVQEIGTKNLQSTAGMEIGVSPDAATTVLRRAGLQIVSKADGGAQGSLWDYAFAISNQIVVQPWKNGILFGGEFGGWAFDSSSSLIQVTHAANDATVGSNYGRGIDLWEGIPNQFQFRGVGPFVLDPTGNLQIGPGLIKPLTTGIAIDLTGNVATGIAVAAGGTNYQIGDWVYFGTGGVGKISNVSAGGVVTAVTMFRPPYIASGATPANPLATTNPPHDPTNVAGSGLTLNVTWATTPNELDLNPGGGNIVAGTGAALATNATSGFIQIATMAGAPTGIVGAAGKAAVVIDTTNKKICYSTGGGTWECSAAFTP